MWLIFAEGAGAGSRRVEPRGEGGVVAFWVFMGFYVICAIVTWVVFLRIQTARADAGEEIGRTVASVPAT
jgi:hypothetical protein